MQYVMDVWLRVQQAYLYLEPVFGAEDITKQMQAEGGSFDYLHLEMIAFSCSDYFSFATGMFQVVDSNWRKLMTEVSLDTKVLIIFVPVISCFCTPFYRSRASPTCNICSLF